MKPKDLPPPFSWKERRLILKDRILYAPGCLESYPLPFSSWQDPQAFSNPNALSIELCSGNGDWVVAQAEKAPQMNWIAIEKRFDRVRKIWSKMKNRGLQNLMIICGEATLSLNKFFIDQSVEACYINFPDPWPKARHAKHRLIQRPFLDQVARILIPRGRFVFVTDDIPYRDQGIRELTAHRAFIANGTSFKTEWAGYGDSWFEKLFRMRGKGVYYLDYQLTCDGVIEEASPIC